MSKYSLYYYDKNNVYIHNKLHNKIFKKEDNLFILTDKTILDLAQKVLFYKSLDSSIFPEIDLIITERERSSSIDFKLIKTAKLLHFLDSFNFPTDEFLINKRCRNNG